jgi:hypothetical protein
MVNDYCYDIPADLLIARLLQECPRALAEVRIHDDCVVCVCVRVPKRLAVGMYVCLVSGCRRLLAAAPRMPMRIHTHICIYI